MIHEEDVFRILDIIENKKIKYYVNAGFALKLQKIGGDEDDFDVRIYSKNLDMLLKNIKEKHGLNAQMLNSRNYSAGKYCSKCIRIFGNTKFDIYSEMKFENDLGKIIFPYNNELFDDINLINYCGKYINVAKPEQLLLYYLVLRRGDKDEKNDIENILSLKQSNLINHKKFEKYLKLANNTNLESIYENYYLKL